METKLDLLNRLLEELESGVPEDRIREEYDAVFGKGALDRLINPRMGGTKRFDENPLVLRAEENGAIRALRENRQKDRNGPKDGLRVRRLNEEIGRLSGITLHYNKVKELILPMISDLDQMAKDEIISDRDVALDNRKAFSSALARSQSDQPLKGCFDKRVSSLAICVRTENEYLYPLLDERLNDFSLFLLKQIRDTKGYFLICYRNEKDLNHERNN